MTEIFDIDRCPRLKIHNVLEAGFASIYKWNGERGEPILLGLLEKARLNRLGGTPLSDSGFLWLFSFPAATLQVGILN